MVSAALGVGGVLALPLVAGLTYVGVDLVRTEMGFVCELQQQLAAGSLWLAPHIGNGQPMFADPQFQLLYPPRWLFLWLPADLAASAAAIFQLALGAAGAAWLLRSYGVRAAAATCLAMAFAFSGTALNLIWHASYLTGAAWLPWAWASGRRLLQGATSRWIRFALFTSLGLLLLGAEPQSFATALAILALEALIRHRRPHARRAVLHVGALVLAAVGVGLAQWLPASAELALTPRSGSLDPSEVLRWSFSPPQWVAAIAPGILEERVAPGTSLWLLWYGPRTLVPWNPSPYFGALLVCVALLGLRHRRAWPAFAVGAVATLISLGDLLPLLPSTLRAFPVLGVFRYPSKLLLPSTLAAVTVAGVVLQRLARGGKAERRAFLVSGGALGAALALAAIVLVTFGSAVDAWAMAAPVRESIGSALPQLSTLLLQATLQGAAPLWVSLGLVAARKNLAQAVPLVVCVDLLLAAPTAVSLGPRLDQIVSPLSRLTAPEGVVLCHSSEVLGVTVRLKEETGPWSANLTLRALAVPNVNACDAIVAGVAYSVVQTRLNARYESALVGRSAAAARALGCTHLVARAAPPDEVTRAVSTSLDGPLLRVSQLNDPIPAAFVAQPRLIATEAEVAQLVLQAHSADSLLAVADDPLGRLDARAKLPQANGVSISRLEHPMQNQYRIELAGSGGAVVGVRTSFQAGWRAVQAGRELPIVRLAGAHVAAVVDDAAAGPLELEYLPRRLAAGFEIAGAGLIFGGIVIGKPLRRRRPRQR